MTSRPAVTSPRENNRDVIRRELAAIYPQSEQLMLDIEILTTPDYEKTATIQERFEAFHAANPWVYDAFVALTEDWIRRGHTRIGIKMLAEVLRWQYGRKTADSSSFKLNNVFPSRYVRRMLAEHPEWADVFETRELKSA